MKYFFSVSGERTFECKIKSSRFIAHLKKVETIAQAKDYISSISAKHQNASHNCWAFIVGDRAENMHSSDAGEPAGTAGKPILNMLKKHEMTNIVAVVTRYFGGTKLGIRGLIDAYGTSVEKVISLQPLTKLINWEKFVVRTDYAFSEQLKYRLQKLDAIVEKAEYAIEVTYRIKVESHKRTNLMHYLEELENAGKLSWEKS